MAGPEMPSARYRSPAAWLAEVTRESYGHCTNTVAMAMRVIEMPLLHASFRAGDLAETGLRLLSETWAPGIADEFARDEAMLLGWATSLPPKDLALLLDTWRMHVDPDREATTAQERFDQRSVHQSKLLDGVGRLDGTMDPEGYQLLHEAIRALSQPAEDETRTAAQRRHDALVQMAKIVLESFTPLPGKKRRKFDLLLIRDHGCRWRGSNIPAAGCDAHHADHWLDCGETEPDNLVLLCWYHHHLLHEQHWRMKPHGGGHFTLEQPDGRRRILRPPQIGAALPS